MSDVIVVIGAGQIGQAIARRAGIGKHVLLAGFFRRAHVNDLELTDRGGSRSQCGARHGGKRCDSTSM